MTALFYPRFGGHHTPTAGMAHMLDGRGVKVPGTGSGFSEALLFGIGGGINLAWFVLQHLRQRGLRLVGAHAGLQASVLWHEWLGQRLGVPVLRRETTGDKAAQRMLRECLEAGVPVLLWLDPQHLPWNLCTPGSVGATELVCPVACGFDGPDVLLDERGPQPWRLDWNQLNLARTSQPNLRCRMLVVGNPEAGLKLRQAVVAGLQQSVANLAQTRQPRFGVEGLRQLTVALEEAPNGRTNHPGFATAPDALRSLMDLHDCLLHGGRLGGSGLLRGLFATFLREAGLLLGQTALNDVAGMYDRLHEAWLQVARQLLPPDEPLAVQAQALLAQRRQVLEQQGAAGMEELARLNLQLEALEHEPALHDFWSPLQVRTHQLRLADALQTPLKLETEALQALQQGVNALAARPRLQPVLRQPLRGITSGR